MPNITAVIMTYLRPRNLAGQIRQLEEQSVPPDEVIIAHLEGEKTEEFDFQDYRTITFRTDPGPRSKMIAGLCHDRETNFLVLLDDDVIPGRQWIKNALDCYQRRKGIYGGSLGFYVDLELDEPYWGVRPDGGWRRDPIEEIVQVDFVGQSWFMRPEHLSLLWKKPLPFDACSGGDDLWLGYCAWKEGVNCYLTPAPQDCRKKWGAIRRPQADMNQSIHQRDDHHSDRQSLIKRAVTEGWDTIGRRIPQGDYITPTRLAN